MVFKTITNFICVLYRFYPVLPMGKTDCFTQFYPILLNWFYPLGKTYMPTLVHAERQCDCANYSLHGTVAVMTDMIQIVISVSDDTVMCTINH